jgi:hypothetical protein
MTAKKQRWQSKADKCIKTEQKSIPKLNKKPPNHTSSRH